MRHPLARYIETAGGPDRIICEEPPAAPSLKEILCRVATLKHTAQKRNLSKFTTLIATVKTMLISFKKMRAKAYVDMGLGASDRSARRLCRPIGISPGLRLAKSHKG